MPKPVIGRSMTTPTSCARRRGTQPRKSQRHCLNGQNLRVLDEWQPRRFTRLVKIAFISDIHSNLEALQTVLDNIADQGCDRTYCLGDVVGYGPNPNECCALIRQMGIPTTMGNHDEAAVVNNAVLELGMNQLAVESLQWTRKVLFSEHRQWLASLPFTIDLPELEMVLCHANLHYPRGWGYIQTPYEAHLTFQRLEQSICFFGHTHVAGIISLAAATGKIEATSAEMLQLWQGARFLINCGSVGQPRDGDPRSCYVLYDTTIKTVAVRRVSYPKEITQDKIIDQNLPPQLAFRLRSMKCRATWWEGLEDL
jgi:predicted phosphodiesterase